MAGTLLGFLKTRFTDRLARRNLVSKSFTSYGYSCSTNAGILPPADDTTMESCSCSDTRHDCSVSIQKGVTISRHP